MLVSQITKQIQKFLPRVKTGLLPTFSAPSLRLHVEEVQIDHLKAVDRLTIGTPFADLTSLEELIQRTHHDAAHQQLYGHAAELWNHLFLFDSLVPHQDQTPMSSFLEELIITHFESPDRFYFQFAAHANAIHGSGWTWLLSREGDLEIYSTFNRQTALIHPRSTPLIALDMFEHAYLTDYGDRKDYYARDFWSNVDWTKVEDRYQSSLNIHPNRIIQ